jgi:dolichyl-phosphate beta-glucosyltransferase
MKKSDKNFSYEVIVVDDGSTDKTCEIALKYSKKYTTDLVRLLKLEKNRGKGGAIRMVNIFKFSFTFLFESKYLYC